MSEENPQSSFSGPPVLDQERIDAIIYGKYGVSDSFDAEPHGRVRKSCRVRYSIEIAELFLRLLRKNRGNVTASCTGINAKRQTVYEWRETHSAFAAAWDAVIEAGIDDLEREAWRRAHEGFLEPVFYQGEVVGNVRKFSDNLMIRVLEAHRPEKYRQRELKITVEQAHNFLAEAAQNQGLPWVEPKQLNPKPEE